MVGSKLFFICTSKAAFPKLLNLEDHTTLQNILADQKIFRKQSCRP